MYIQLATSTLFKLCVQTVASNTPNGPIQKRHFQQRIVDMDSNQHSHTFNGGFDAVVHLYRSHLSAPNNGS